MTAPAGNDIPFDDSICEQGRNFTNKIWNALRLIKGWEVADKPQSEVNAKAVAWLNDKINSEIASIDESYTKYRLNDAAMSIYKLVWDEFCSWYLEAIKPAYGDSIDKTTYEQTLVSFEKLMVILHPMMPFITEEVYHALAERTDNDCAILAHWPTVETFDKAQLEAFEEAKSIISEVRAFRAQKGLSPREQLKLAQKGNAGKYASFDSIVKKLANVDLAYNESIDGPSSSFIVGTLEFSIPMEGLIDVAAEKAKLEEELKYQEGFLNSIMKKLGNEKFVAGAPEQVVAAEQKKKADAESRIASITQMLNSLG